MKPAFGIGDTVFMADYARRERRITCPDCLGSKRVRVILADDTEVSIECGGCDPGGYRPSQGFILQWDYEVTTRKHIVSGVTVGFSKPVEYRLDESDGRCYLGSESTVFGTVEEAIAYGETLREDHESARNKEALSKTRGEKSWKWNAAYHRQQATRCRTELAYHEAKAVVCKANVEEKVKI